MTRAWATPLNAPIKRLRKWVCNRAHRLFKRPTSLVLIPYSNHFGEKQMNLSTQRSTVNYASLNIHMGMESKATLFRSQQSLNKGWSTSRDSACWQLELGRKLLGKGINAKQQTPLTTSYGAYVLTYWWVSIAVELWFAVSWKKRWMNRVLSKWARNERGLFRCSNDCTAHTGDLPSSLTTE